MSVATYTKTGNKASVAAKLDKAVFGLKVDNHELVKQAYLSYLANGRTNNAITKKRGQVRGGGRKPWQQKGTGNARVGSIRSPIWRGGGITFGPTGQENYGHRLSTQAKRQALRQALSLAADSNKIIVIESFEAKEGKTQAAQALLNKVGATGNVVLAVDHKDQTIDRAVKNLPNVRTTQAVYLNVFDILNADQVVLTSAGLSAVHTWLGATKPAKAAVGDEK
ncbi:MAG TPA: 50S ribosomal protein L4 [Candidatus Saccharimonadales bacterium]|nr:50S ribosomal protein L4 [Candidatus Saccharimonadales bacterium]